MKSVAALVVAAGVGVAALASHGGHAFAQYTTFNFQDRKALVLDVCPHVKITSFSHESTARQGCT